MSRFDVSQPQRTAWLVLLLLVVPQAFGGASRPAGNTQSSESVSQALTNYPGGSRALLIGNSQYQKGWSNLPAVDADLERMQQLLQRQGFPTSNIRVERNLSGEQFARVLSEFAATAPSASVPAGTAMPRSRAVIYIAGHGSVQIDPVSGRPIGFFVPVDAPLPESRAREFHRLAIPVSRLSSDAVQMPDSDVLYLLDSCYPGTALQVTPTTAFGPQDLVARTTRVRQVIAAGTDDQVVADDGGFTSRIASGLGGLADLNRDGRVTATELGTYVRLHLADRSGGRQTPVFGNLVVPGAGIGLGDTSFALLESRSARAASNTTPAVGAPFRDCAQCPELVPLLWAPLGLHQSDVDLAQRRTYGLAVGRFEVLFEEWDQCFAEGGCRRWLPDRGMGRGRLPAFGVTLVDAQQFTAWLSNKTRQAYRLPSEVEWRAAARGAFTASSADARWAPGHGNCNNCGSIWDGRLAPAGQFTANEFGLHDMLGNLWELTSSCGVAATSCVNAVVVGAAFSTLRSDVSAESRGIVPATFADRNIGFRVVRELRD